MSEEWRRLHPRTLLAGAAVLCGVAGGAALPAVAGRAGGRPLGFWPIPRATSSASCAAIPTERAR
ncbi:hypothetical protein AB0F16_21550, partial [Streptomyces tanashiensis]